MSGVSDWHRQKGEKAQDYESPNEGFRRCPCCETDKPVGEFKPKDGYCYPCRLAYARAWSKSHKNKLASAKRQRERSQRLRDKV